MDHIQHEGRRWISSAGKNEVKGYRVLVPVVLAKAKLVKESGYIRREDVEVRG